MVYELYVDSLYLLNFNINLCLLFLADRRLHGAATLLGLIGADLIGSLVSVIPLFTDLPLEWSLSLGALLGNGVIFLTAFRIRTIRGFLRGGARYLCDQILIGGILAFLFRLFPKTGRILGSVTGLSLAAVFLCILMLYAKRNHRNEEICEVLLINGERQVRMHALVDTGNSLTEPVSGKPVSLIGKDTFRELYGMEGPEYYRVIPYHSVGKKSGVLKGIFLPQMEVITGGIGIRLKDVCIAVAEELSEGIADRSPEEVSEAIPEGNAKGRTGRDGTGNVMILNPLLLEATSYRKREETKL